MWRVSGDAVRQFTEAHHADPTNDGDLRYYARQLFIVVEFTTRNVRKGVTRPYRTSEGTSYVYKSRKFNETWRLLVRDGELVQVERVPRE